DGNFGLLLVIHAELVGAFEPGHNLLDAVDIHHIRTVRPPEEVRIEHFHQLFEGAAIRVALHMGRRHRDDAFLNGGVTNILLIDQEEPAGGAEQDLGGLRPLGFEHLDQGLEPIALRRSRVQFGACLLYRLLYALHIKRLKQIINCIDLEGLYCILIKGGGEDDLRYWLLLVDQLLDYPKAVEARHLHVEKDQIWIVFLDQADCLHAVAAFGQDLDIANLFEQVVQLFTSQLFVIDDYGGNGH